MHLLSYSALLEREASSDCSFEMEIAIAITTPSLRLQYAQDEKAELQKDGLKPQGEEDVLSYKRMSGCTQRDKSDPCHRNFT